MLERVLMLKMVMLPEPPKPRIIKGIPKKVWRLFMHEAAKRGCSHKDAFQEMLELWISNEKGQEATRHEKK